MMSRTVPLVRTVSFLSLVTVTDEPRARTCTVPNCGRVWSVIAC